jgi:hypothetical protein
MMGMFRSAALGGQVMQPLSKGMNELEMLRKSMQNTKLLVMLDDSKKEYNC